MIKRSNARFWRTYGHWWLELDGKESYGWWADHCPLRLRDLLFGATGTLNGVGGTCRGGTPTTDPHHLEEADHSFSPTLTVAKSDEQLREDIRSFARSYSGRWHWSTKANQTGCHPFQLHLFQAVGLGEEPEHLHTRGPGCPFMYPLRSAGWRLQDLAVAISSLVGARMTRRRPCP